VFFSTDVMVRHQKVQVCSFAIFSPVFNNQNTKVLVLQSGPCSFLETLDHFLNLLLRWLVSRRKGNHSRGIGIFVSQTVHQPDKKYRVPSPHDHLLSGSFFQQISRRFLSRSPRP